MSLRNACTVATLGFRASSSVLRRPNARLLVLAALALGALAAGGDTAASARQPSVHDTFLVVTWTWRGMPESRIEILGDDGRMQRLIEKTQPPPGISEAHWSPDGSRIAWAGPRGVVVAKSDGTQRQLVFPNRVGCRSVCSDDFAWSPDGRRLVISYRDAAKYISRFVVLTLRTRQLVNLAFDLSRPRRDVTYRVNGWSRTGWISYFREIDSPVRGPSSELVLVRPDGTRPRGVFSWDPLHRIGLAWSPNGRYIAITTEAPSGLGVIDVATGKLHRSHTVGATAITPVWSPDSKRIVVGGVTVNRDGSGVRRLPVDGYPTVWSRRTRNLYILHGIDSRYVYVSPRAELRPKLLFAMPRHQGVLLMDVK